MYGMKSFRNKLSITSMIQKCTPTHVTMFRMRFCFSSLNEDELVHWHIKYSKERTCRYMSLCVNANICIMLQTRKRGTDAARQNSQTSDLSHTLCNARHAAFYSSLLCRAQKRKTAQKSADKQPGMALIALSAKGGYKRKSRSFKLFISQKASTANWKQERGEVAFPKVAFICQI